MTNKISKKVFSAIFKKFYTLLATILTLFNKNVYLRMLKKLEKKIGLNLKKKSVLIPFKNN